MMQHGGADMGVTAVRGGRGGDNGWACPDGMRGRNWDGGSACLENGVSRMHRVRGVGSGGRRGGRGHGGSGQVMSRTAGLGMAQANAKA